MIIVENLYLDLGEFKLQGVSLEAGKGEYLVVLGPSGAGKTLLLECIAGLRKPVRGRIVVDGVDVTNFPPEKRELAYVPQDYALWPHMTVYRNIAYPLRCRRFSKAEIKRRVKWIAEELGISHLLNRKPGTLSGGEKQRVALARALAWNPKAVLLDEPTAALDPALKSSAWKLLKNLHSKLKFTAIHVTHNLAEAATLAEKTAFMYGGVVVKQGKLNDVLATHEASMYLGDANVYRGKVVQRRRGEIVVDVYGTKIVTIADAILGEEVVLMLRPEDVLLLKKPALTSARNTLKVIVEEVESRGPIVLVHVRRGDLRIKAYVTKSSSEHLELKPGKRLYVSFKAAAIKRIA